MSPTLKPNLIQITEKQDKKIAQSQRHLRSFSGELFN